MPDVRRGVAAIEEAATRKGGSGFKPFVPEIFLKEDGESKYLVVLTPIDEVITADIHSWIPVGTGEKSDGTTYTKHESFLSRKDPSIGESYDRIIDDFDRAPKTRCLGVVAELVPEFETVNGRKKPKSFTVKTDTYTRKTDDGEEEVTYPVIGIMDQSSYLVWSPLSSYDEAQGPLIDLPLQMIRRGTNANTRYDIVTFANMEIDLSPVVDYATGISYFGDDAEDVEAAMAAADDLAGAAQAAADALLMKRYLELADKDRYDELVGPLTEIPDRWGKSATKKGAKPKAVKRPTRREAEASDEAPVETPEEPSKDDKFAALKARVEGRA